MLSLIGAPISIFKSVDALDGVICSLLLTWHASVRVKLCGVLLSLFKIPLSIDLLNYVIKHPCEMSTAVHSLA